MSPALSVLPRRWSWFLKCLPNVYTQTCYQLSRYLLFLYRCLTTQTHALSRFGPTAVRHRLPQLRRSQKLFLGAITLCTGVALMTPPYTFVMSLLQFLVLSTCEFLVTNVTNHRVSHPHMPTYKVMMTMKSRLGNGPHTRPKIQLFIETVCKIVFSRRSVTRTLLFCSSECSTPVQSFQFASIPRDGHPRSLLKCSNSLHWSPPTTVQISRSNTLLNWDGRFGASVSEPQHLDLSLQGYCKPTVSQDLLVGSTCCRFFGHG